MLRLATLGVTAAGLLLAGGCCAPEPADSGDLGDLTPAIEAPTSAAKGATVALTARLAAGIDPAEMTFRWYQEFGRRVEILNADTAEASFVAPSVATDQTLRFRVDVRGPDGTIYSATVEVIVAADPDYGLETGTEEGGVEDPFPQVRLVTSQGTILLELNREKAPLTVNNFLRYVDDGFYDGTIFHRVIPDFVIQGGGFEPGLIQKQTRPPIRNESDNGLRNDRGTIAMARTNDPDSATSQFYINVVDNDSLNATAGANGYTVFGRVIDGLDVVDRIAEVETGTRQSPEGQTFSDVPVTDVLLHRATRVPASGGDTSD